EQTVFGGGDQNGSGELDGRRSASRRDFAAPDLVTIFGGERPKAGGSGRREEERTRRYGRADSVARRVRRLLEQRELYRPGHPLVGPNSRAGLRVERVNATRVATDEDHRSGRDGHGDRRGVHVEEAG